MISIIRKSDIVHSEQKHHFRRSATDAPDQDSHHGAGSVESGAALTFMITPASPTGMRDNRAPDDDESVIEPGKYR